MNIDREIVNRALDKAGEEPITEAEWTAGTGTRIRLIKDYYLATILETLANTAWTSQKKRAKLEEYTGGDDLTDYNYIYYLPGDCAKPVSISNDAEFIVEGDFLYTDEYQATLLYISNGYTGEYKYTVADPQPTAETFETGKYYYVDSNGKYVLADGWLTGFTYYVIEEEDYPYYDDFKPDPLLSEYIETKLAAKMVLKLTGNIQLYNLLYSEASLMEKRAVTSSVAHGYNKDKGNSYWGDLLGLPTYGEE